MREKFGKGRATPCGVGLPPPLSGLLGDPVTEHLVDVGVGWVGIGYRFFQYPDISDFFRGVVALDIGKGV